MAEETEELLGTDTGGSTDQTEAGTPEETSPKTESGESGREEKPAPRTLEELKTLSRRSDFRMTPEEARRVQYSMKHQVSDEDVITQALEKGAENIASAKSDKPGLEDKKSGKPPESASADDKSNDKPNEDGEGDEDIDSKLLKVIAPHLDENAESVDDAVKSIKNLQHELSRRGEIINAAKDLGINTPDELKQSLSMLKNIDANIAERLKTPEGLAGMYKAFGMETPDWLGKPDAPSQTPAPNASDKSGGQPPEIAAMLEQLDDDGYIGAGDFKKLVPAIVNQAVNAVKEQYQGLETNFKQVGGYVSKLVQRTELDNRVTQTLADAASISTNFGAHDDSLVLKASPNAIWEASVGPDMKVKKEVHPEFETLKRVLKLRNAALKDAHDKSQKLGRNVEPDVMGFLSKQLIMGGGLGDLTRTAAAKAAKRIVSNLSRPMQPGVKPRKSESGTFKTPKTEKDLARMSPRDKKLFRDRVRKGIIKLTAEV